MSIGENIAKYRKAKEWSQQKLASVSGISQASIHYWEKNERTPKSKSIAKLARALGVRYEDLDTEAETLLMFEPSLSNVERILMGGNRTQNKTEDIDLEAIEPEDMFWDWLEACGIIFVSEEINSIDDIYLSIDNKSYLFKPEQLNALYDICINQIKDLLKGLSKLNE